MRWFGAARVPPSLRRASLRPAAGDLLARSRAFPCHACGLLLGSFAQRGAACPRCRAPVRSAERTGGGFLRPVILPPHNRGWLMAMHQRGADR